MKYLVHRFFLVYPIMTCLATWLDKENRPGLCYSTALVEQGFQFSISWAGTPTVTGYAERFVVIFKLTVAERQPYQTPGYFLRTAEAWVNFYNRERPHESLGYRSPHRFAEE